MSLAIRAGTTLLTTTLTTSHFISLSLPNIQIIFKYNKFHSKYLSNASTLPVTYNILLQTTITSHLDKSSITQNNSPNFTFTPFQYSLFIEAKWYFEDTDQGRVISLQCAPTTLRRPWFLRSALTWCVDLLHQRPSAWSPTNFPFAPYTEPHLCSFRSFMIIFSNSEPFYLHFPLPVILYFSALPPLPGCSSENNLKHCLSTQLTLISLLSQHLYFSVNITHYSYNRVLICNNLTNLCLPY